jgi:hypothetical protein
VTAAGNSVTDCAGLLDDRGDPNQDVVRKRLAHVQARLTEAAEPLESVKE